MRIASTKYQTAVMKDDEVLMFVETAMENGSTPEEAISDMRMIDNLLHMKRLHLAVHGQIKKTTAGHLRKGTSLFDSLNSIIDGRLIRAM